MGGHPARVAVFAPLPREIHPLPAAEHRGGDNTPLLFDERGLCPLVGALVADPRRKLFSLSAANLRARVFTRGTHGDHRGAGIRWLDLPPFAKGDVPCLPTLDEVVCRLPQVLEHKGGFRR